MPVFSAVRTMADHWWVVLLRGLFAIAFGMMAYRRECLLGTCVEPT